ncbi:hypothetical protein [Caenimonas koreensis]|uniref:hypothetical protein n=1 Tax=Caenimonas koreensis TaxID=367474 RepID=UPI003784F444
MSQLPRRQFLRVAGGLSVAAATLSLSGCSLSSDYPAEAVQAWAGPGQERDVRRWILGWAILAPHSHNLQSWLVDLSRPDEITLYCDRTWSCSPSLHASVVCAQTLNSFPKASLGP